MNDDPTPPTLSYAPACVLPSPGHPYANQDDQPRRPWRFPPEPTSLDPVETPFQGSIPSLPADRDPDADKKTILWRHSFWQRKRQAVVAALHAVEATASRIERFEECGSRAWILRDHDHPDHVRIAGSHCRDRFCDACMVEHRRLIARNFAEQVPKAFVRLLTLTLKHAAAGLAGQLDRLYEAFGRFRRHPEIRDRIAGGIAFLEVKANPTTREWHPHLHILFEGSYLPQPVASAVWLEITGDSYVVDVRKIGNAAAGGSYLLKYATKALSPTVWTDADHLQEAITALHGRRTFNAFGTWRTLNLSRPAPDDATWDVVAPLHTILDRARLGDEQAQALLRLLRRNDCELPADLSNDAAQPP